MSGRRFRVWRVGSGACLPPPAASLGFLCTRGLLAGAGLDVDVGIHAGGAVGTRQVHLLLAGFTFLTAGALVHDLVGVGGVPIAMTTEE